MKRILTTIAAVLMAFAGILSAVAQDSGTNSSANADSNSSSPSNARLSFESFRVIERNNIFNPFRQPRRTNGPPPQRVYTFTLNGTMTYQNKAYAFFGGNGVTHDGILAPSDTINGYKISEITNNAVKLAAASNQFITMRVGMQMRREEHGPWKLITTSVAPEMPPAASDDTSSDSSSPDKPAAAAATDAAANGPHADVLARLMARRRAQEGDTNSATSTEDTNQ